jgi:small conductance mechanosensitive channel
MLLGEITIPLLAFAEENPCSDTDQLCGYVWDLSHQAWLAEAANWLIAKPFVIVCLLVGALVARWATHRVIDRLLVRPSTGAARAGISQADIAGAARRALRLQTLGTLLHSISTGVVFLVVGVMALAELGVNIAPILASAGILGLAIGFGAQAIVKDFLGGLFLLFEDQYGVGDTITVGTTSGVVEAISLRITRLRAEDGTAWYLRNGEILTVNNRSQG